MKDAYWLLSVQNAVNNVVAELGWADLNEAKFPHLSKPLGS